MRQFSSLTYKRLQQFKIIMQQHPSTPRRGISLSLNKRSSEKCSPKYMSKPVSNRRNLNNPVSNQKMNQTFDTYFIPNTVSVRKSVPEQMNRQSYFTNILHQDIANNVPLRSNFVMPFPARVSVTNQPRRHPCVIYRVETGQNYTKNGNTANISQARQSLLGQSKVQKIGINQYCVSKVESQEQRLVKQKKRKIQQMQHNLHSINKQLEKSVARRPISCQHKIDTLKKFDECNKPWNQMQNPKITFSHDAFPNHIQVVKANQFQKNKHNKTLPIRQSQHQHVFQNRNQFFNNFPIHNSFLSSVILQPKQQNYQINVVQPKQNKAQTQNSFIRNLYSTANNPASLVPIEQNQIKQFDVESTPKPTQQNKAKLNELASETPCQFKIEWGQCSKKVNLSSQKKKGKIKRKLRGDRLMQIQNRLNEIIKKVNSY